MPSRVNGIGTAYVGRSNLRVRTGTCEACGRTTTLSGYDTRLWFTLIFVPVIPLRRTHVSDFCAACTTHRAMPKDEWESKKRETLEAAARKAHAEPGNAEAQIELHRHCLFFEEWEKADAFQKRLEADFASDPKVQVHLAQAHAWRGRADEAARALARAKALDPNLPIEPPTAPKKAPPAPRNGLIFALAAVAAVVVAGGASVYKSMHREVHIVSGLDGPVTVHVDGEPPVTLSRGRHTITVGEGRRSVRLTGAVEDTVELAIESGFVGRLFDDRTFVLNPGGAAVLLLEEAAYAKRTEDAKGERPPEFLYGRPVEVLKGIDYLFKPFPQQISTKSSGVTIKRRLDVVDDPPLSVMMWLSANGRARDALGFAEWALRTRPAQRGHVAPAYVSLARRAKELDRAVGTLRGLAAARPVDVEIHRAYQEAAGPASLAVEYDAELAKTPGDSALLYLRGRLETGIAAGLAWFEKALAADPANPWAHYAVGYGLSSRGDWAPAVAALEKAVALQPQNLAYRRALRQARFGAGRLDDLEKELEEARRNRILGYETADDLALLTAMRGKPADALALADRSATPLRGFVDDDDLDAVLVGVKAAALYAAGDFQGLSTLAGADPEDVPYQRAHGFLELGKVDEALEILEEPDGTALLAVALLRSDDEGAVRRAAEALEADDDDAAPLAKALRSGAAGDVDAALDANVDGRLKAPALALLARRIPARAQDLRAQAARLNVVPVFPHHLVKRALAR